MGTLIDSLTWKSRSLLQHELTRRSLLTRGLALGLSSAAFTTLLAACADADDTDDSAVAEPADDDVDEPDDATDEPDDDSVDEETEDEQVEDEDDSVDDDEDPENGDEGVYGGTLYVALLGEPPRIDVQAGTGVTVNFVAWNIWETILTWDEDFDPVPELAESLDVSDDGLTITLPLRQGVMFHNGEEMTAVDVIASIERWAEVSPRSRGFADTYDEIEQTDDYTIEIRMNEPLGPLTTLLSRQSGGCAINPASVIEAANGGDLQEFIGTGPYYLDEYVPDQHIHVERFEDYSSREEEPTGYAGRKYQYLDEIFYIPVPDEAARISGLQAGDYHFLEAVSPDQFDAIDDDPDIVAEILPPQQWGAWVLNTQDGVMANQSIRQAIQACLDCEPMLIAGYGADFIRLDPSLMFPESAWYSTAGEEFYNQGDPERARELAEEGGYDGEPIRLMTSQEYLFLYNMAVVCEQQLEDAGFNVDLQTMDWATLQDRRNDPADWDIFTTFHPFFPDPIMFPHVAGTTWPGWWDTDRKNELAHQFWTETDFDARFAVWEELQALHYEEVPQVKIGDASELSARSARLKNAPAMVQVGPSFWNSWLE